MLMNVHQEKAENLPLPEIAQEFVWESQYEKRKTYFVKLMWPILKLGKNKNVYG